MIGSGILNQSDAKLKPITTWSPAFSRALDSLLVFYFEYSLALMVFSFLTVSSVKVSLNLRALFLFYVFTLKS